MRSAPDWSVCSRIARRGIDSREEIDLWLLQAIYIMEVQETTEFTSDLVYSESTFYILPLFIF